MFGMAIGSGAEEEWCGGECRRGSGGEPWCREPEPNTRIDGVDDGYDISLNLGGDCHQLKGCVRSQAGKGAGKKGFNKWQAEVRVKSGARLCLLKVQPASMGNNQRAKLLSARFACCSSATVVAVKWFAAEGSSSPVRPNNGGKMVHKPRAVKPRRW
jgi:hypothetical protein